MGTLDRTRFIERLPSGETRGLDPRVLPKDDLRALGHPESPIAAIRAHCVACSGGSWAEARRCQSLLCPLWAYRMGVNVFHARAESEGNSATREHRASENPGNKPGVSASNGHRAAVD